MGLRSRSASSPAGDGAGLGEQSDRSGPSCSDQLLKRGGKVWIRIFPDKPVTHKPAETRMGSGKGNPVLGCRRQAGRGAVRGGWRHQGTGRGSTPRSHEDADGLPFIERQHIGVAAAAEDEESRVPEEVVA